MYVDHLPRNVDNHVADCSTHLGDTCIQVKNPCPINSLAFLIQHMFLVWDKPKA